MHKILIIGTVPPCPRCKLLTEIVTKLAANIELSAEIRHISYESEEASEIAGRFGLKPGTAKDVAKIIGKDVRLEDMPKASQMPDPESLKNLDSVLKEYETLFKEVDILDNWLRPFEHQSKDAGILMTPVLIIDEEIKHNGSVPDPVQIEKWLSELAEV